MSGRRLPSPAGVRIDRSRGVSFTFNGRKYSGLQGDTLASALLANGVQLVGRSFKLHRPRGIYSCGIEEPTGLVDIGVGARRTPNARATVVELYEGLIAESVNCWPDVRLDVGAITSAFSALLPAGFYYKTFKWPNWHMYEPTIRRLAGLGRASRERDPDRYEEVAVSTDVLVVGGGIAGLAAATAAAESGAQVLLLSSSPEFGGVLGWQSDAQVSALIAKAETLGVRMLTRTLAFGIYDHNLVCARQLCAGAFRPSGAGGELRERLWKIRARAVIAATGAFERPVVFPNNDRPGVMLAGAAEKYALAFGAACGSRVVIAANSDRAYAVGASLRKSGVDVAAIVDVRSEDHAHFDGRACQGIPIVHRAAIASVSGKAAVRGCSIAPLDGVRDGVKIQRFDCDLILCAGGHAPAVHLHSQAGGRLRWLEEPAMFVPDGPAPGLFSVGACAGVFSREDALSHAHEVGEQLARGLPVSSAPVGGGGRSMANTHVPRKGAKQFIDLQNDVTANDVALAACENYRSVEHLKRYTTIGMGTDQGKTSNVNALALMGEETGARSGCRGHD